MVWYGVNNGGDGEIKKGGLLTSGYYKYNGRAVMISTITDVCIAEFISI